MDKCERSELRVILMDNCRFSIGSIYTTFPVKHPTVSTQSMLSWRICLTFSTVFICRI